LAKVDPKNWDEYAKALPLGTELKEKLNAAH
jgi:hypothetical protein